MAGSALISEVKLLRWRWLRNASSTFAYLTQRKALTASAKSIVRQLRDDGICVRQSAGDPAIFAEVFKDATGRSRDSWTEGSARPGTSNRLRDRAVLGGGESKGFLSILLPRELPGDTAYLRYALQPQFIEVANAYLGMAARLSAVHLWFNVPTPGGPQSTQLWHKDADDFMNVKIFTYLSVVQADTGPFAFVPRTHPLGAASRRLRVPAVGRITDEEVEAVFPRSEWLVCTGNPGTTVFADTCGLHKGVKPITAPRLMLMCQYTSAQASSAPDLIVRGPLPSTLTHEQRRALEGVPFAS